MREKVFSSDRGDIHYWISEYQKDRQTLVFLPGLTADHRLFDRQMEAFEGRYNLFVWDAPGHAASRPFRLDFALRDKAAWLHEILKREGIVKPILVGQSMGGYVAQSYLHHFPGEAAGFVSIDSAPLKRKYITAAEIWLLKRMEPVYLAYPYGLLIRQGASGTAMTPYGRELMADMWRQYEKREFCRLSAHGFKILAEAIEQDLSYEIDCPAILICGEKDQAGSAKSYNRKWAKGEGLPLLWVKGAGHNANTDDPETVNRAIEELAQRIRQG